MAINEDEKLAFKDNQVTQINGIVVKRDACTELQAKILTYIASMVKDGDTDKTPYKIKITEFFDMTREKEKKLDSYYYKTIRSSLIELRKIGIELETKTEKDVLYTTFPFVIESTYHSKKGEIDVFLNNRLIELYSKYDQRFTKINVLTVMLLKGKYTVPLYEFLLSWQGAKKVACTTEEIRTVLAIPIEKYKKSSDFFKWCLNPALEEINEKADIKVIMKPIEIYRQQIKKMEFKISPNKPIVKIPKSLTKSEQFLTDAGISSVVAKKIASAVSFERIKGNYELTIKRKLEGKVKSFTAYLVNAIENDYAYVDGDLFGDVITQEAVDKAQAEYKILKEQQDELLQQEFIKNEAHKLSPAFEEKLNKKIKK